MSTNSLDKSREATVASLSALVDDHGAEIESFAALLVEKFHLGRKLLLIGSGPLGAVADLAASLFQHRMVLNRPPLPVLSLSHEAVLATSLLRDGLGRQLFSRPLRVLASPDDLVLALCEGSHDDVIDEALDAAREIGCQTAVVASRKWESIGASPDFLFPLAADPGPRLTETALFFCHLLCEQVEARLFGM